MKTPDGKGMNVPSKTPEEIKKGLNVLYPPSVNTSYEEYVKAISCIADAIAYIQKLEAQAPKWISVEERLPKPFVSVIVYMPEEAPCPTVHEGYLRTDNTWYSAFFVREFDEVTHWMPLPEPKKEET